MNALSDYDGIPFYYLFYINSELKASTKLEENYIYSNSKAYFNKYMIFLMRNSNFNCPNSKGSVLVIEVILKDEDSIDYIMDVYSNFNWNSGYKYSNTVFRFEYPSLNNSEYLFFRLEAKDDYLNKDNILRIETICREEWNIIINTTSYYYNKRNLNSNLIKFIYNRTEEDEFHICIRNIEYIKVYGRKLNDNIYNSIVDEEKTLLICNKTNIVLYNEEYLQIYIELDLSKTNDNEDLYIDIVNKEDKSLSLIFKILIIMSGAVVMIGGITIVCYQLNKYVLRKYK